jgi:hypothetical protein
MAVSLKTVVDEAAMSSDVVSVWLHRTTGEIVALVDDMVADDIDESRADRERVDASDAFVRVPTQDSRMAFRVMEQFCASVTDAMVRVRLEDALSGKGAFRRFKDMVHQRGIAQDWYRFEATAQAREIKSFLEAEGIAFIDDLSKP